MRGMCLSLGWLNYGVCKPHSYYLNYAFNAKTGPCCSKEKNHDILKICCFNSWRLFLKNAKSSWNFDAGQSTIVKWLINNKKNGISIFEFYFLYELIYNYFEQQDPDRAFTCTGVCVCVCMGFFSINHGVFTANAISEHRIAGQMCINVLFE